MFDKLFAVIHYGIAHYELTVGNEYHRIWHTIPIRIIASIYEPQSFLNASKNRENIKTMKIFSDLSDLRGVTKAQDLAYMRIVRQFMRLLGVYPSRQLGDVDKTVFLHQFISIMVTWVCFPLITMYIKNTFHKLSFLEQGHNYITMLMGFIAATRITVIFSTKYYKLAVDFINKIHLFNFRNTSDYAMETHLFIHKLSHFATMYVHGLMVVGLTLYNLLPLYISYASGMFSEPRPTNGTFAHSIYLELPFDYLTDFRGYLVVFAMNWYISLTCSTLFCTFDLYMTLLVFHIWGHLRIIIYNLVNFPRPKQQKLAQNEYVKLTEVEWYSNEENEEVKLRLKNVIEHHLLIIEFVERVSDTFGPLLFIYYLFHQACGCLLLLECFQMETNALLRYGLLTLIIFQQLAQLSLVLELLGSMTDSLCNAAYFLPWECMDTGNRRAVQILLRQTQRRIHVKAMDMVEIGGKSMVTIIKTSLSYFIMLRAVADNE